jgi:hypothetical protein
MIIDGRIQIGLNLEGELANKFRAVKRRKGLVNNTDVLRLLISETYGYLKEKGDLSSGC